MIVLFAWVMLAACLALLGRLLDLKPLLAVGAVMTLMTVVFV